ncbi:hypothetical protein BUALT_Bualt09G0042200 [Buddleja alternifolia]|uniref:DUF985 domain-containing protein n=1 Tax=Buddleja alternifolia TaxID=168488 RepID=A0AAV6X731_9LAMI|nr:hypothetical protein BUALT_Bualt09G0042200 [Buddleja alternifolia]
MASRRATKSDLVAKLNLKPHTEGGYYCETFRDNSIILSKTHLPSHCKSLIFIFSPQSRCFFKLPFL